MPISMIAVVIRRKKRTTKRKEAKTKTIQDEEGDEKYVEVGTVDAI